MLEIYVIKVMRKLIFIFLLLTVLSVDKTVLAQQEDPFKAFKLSFMKSFNYPRIMRDSCIATTTIIKISKTKNQLSIVLSDSTNESFKQDFNKIINKLNTYYLQQILDRKIKGYSILIPVYYVFNADYCTNQVDISIFSSSFTRFNGQIYNGDCMLLEPIVIYLSKPIVN